MLSYQAAEKARPEGQMVKGRWQSNRVFLRFAICHLRFAIQDASFSILLPPLALFSSMAGRRKRHVDGQGTRTNRIVLPDCSNKRAAISPASPSNTTLACSVIIGVNVCSPVGIKNTPGASSGNAISRPS